MRPVALIDRVEAAIAGVAHTQTPPASSTEQQALQQTETFSSRSGENLAIGPVRRQALTVGEELSPGDVARMMVRNDDAPLILCHEAGLSADLAGRPNLLAGLISSEHVSAGVRWIRQDARTLERVRRPQSSLPFQAPPYDRRGKRRPSCWKRCTTA